MPYRVCKTFEIESGHMLSLHPDKCRYPHGHSRVVEFVLGAPDLDANGMVCDFKAVKDLMGAVMEEFGHSLCVNTRDLQYPMLKASYGDRVIGFEEEEPTTEVLARTFYDILKARLHGRMDEQASSGAGAMYPIRGSVFIERVRVWETSSSWAEYFE